MTRSAFQQLLQVVDDIQPPVNVFYRYRWKDVLQEMKIGSSFALACKELRHIKSIQSNTLKSLHRAAEKLGLPYQFTSMYLKKEKEVRFWRVK